MQKVTKYQADDGTLFDSQDEALRHEKVSDLADWLDEADGINWDRPSIRSVAAAAIYWMERRSLPNVEARDA